MGSPLRIEEGEKRNEMGIAHKCSVRTLASKHNTHLLYEDPESPSSFPALCGLVWFPFSFSFHSRSGGSFIHSFRNLPRIFTRRLVFADDGEEEEGEEASGTGGLSLSLLWLRGEPPFQIVSRTRPPLLLLLLFSFAPSFPPRSPLASPYPLLSSPILVFVDITSLSTLSPFFDSRNSIVPISPPPKQSRSRSRPRLPS